MGEAHEYESMQRELDIQTENAAIAKDNLERENRARESAYLKEAGVWWQTGCPFMLKDIVSFSDGPEDLGEGKVVGLPLKDVSESDASYQKVWVHFSSGDRKWIPWDNLIPLRRSPNRLKRSQSMPGTFEKMRILENFEKVASCVFVQRNRYARESFARFGRKLSQFSSEIWATFWRNSCHRQSRSLGP